jgi:hypothetical protein
MSTSRRSAIALGALLILGGMLTPPTVRAVTWGVVRDVSPSGKAAAWADSTVTFGTDGIAVAYREIVNDVYRVFVRRSGDAGLTWKAPQQLSTDAASAASWPAIARGGGRTYAVWGEAESPTADARLMYSRTNVDGFNWSAPIAVSAADQPAGLPAIAANGQGHVAISWTNRSSGKVYVRLSEDGVAFGPRAAVGSSSNQPFADDGDFLIEALPALAMSAGKVALAFHGSSSTVRFRRAVFGEHWQVGQRLSTEALGVWPVELTSNRQTVLVGYTTETRQDSWATVRRSVDSGHTWGSPIAVGNRNDLPSAGPILSVRGQRWRLAFAQCVALCDETAGFYRSSSDGGRTWSPKSRATPGAAKYEVPVGVGYAGRPFMVFLSGGDRPSGRVLVRRGQ